MLAAGVLAAGVLAAGVLTSNGVAGISVGVGVNNEQLIKVMAVRIRNKRFFMMSPGTSVSKN